VESALGVLLLPGLIMMGISFSLVVLAFSAYFRVKGIERACWAIVTQLRELRLREPDPVQEAIRARQRETPAPTGMVSTSMFGR
jgi:hypothetical protein